MVDALVESTDMLSRRSRSLLTASLFAVPAISVLVATACTSFEDAVEGASDAGSDGSTNGDDGTTPADGGALDAQPPLDGAVRDANPCAEPDAYFCDDFERDPNDLRGLEWDQNTGYGPASIAIVTINGGDGGDPPSGTRVLRARHRVPDAGVDAGESSRWLDFVYGAVPGALEVSFSMKVPNLPRPSTQIMEIAFASIGAAGETAVVLSIDESQKIHLFEELTAGSTGNADESVNVDVGQWRRYRLRIDAAKTEARLAIEGRGQEVVLALQRAHGIPNDVRFGVVYEPTQTNTTDTLFDDIVIRR
jgi:hypothetical protein